MTKTLVILFMTFVLSACTNPLGSGVGNLSHVQMQKTIPEISFSNSAGTTGLAGDPMEVTPSILKVNGSAITNCTISPSLPGGLSISASTCKIVGTPVGASSGVYEVIATNEVGSSKPANLSLDIQASRPQLSYVQSTGTVGPLGIPMSISPSLLNSNGSPVTACGISPALPQGLILDPLTCVISGTPVASTTTVHQIAATNSVGSSAPAMLMITVLPAVPGLSYVSSTGTAGSVGSAMTIDPSTFIPNGSLVTSCSSTPALPAGLSISSTTCQISGTPTVVISATYQIVAINTAGSSLPAPVSISVSADVPILSYVGAAGTTTSVGSSLSIDPTNLLTNGAAITNCVSSPILPTGLSISATTCKITGTPTMTSSATYQISASNSAGSSSPASVTVTVLAAVPVLSYSSSTGNSGSAGAPMSIAPSTLQENGSVLTGCSSQPALPLGLTLDSSTCEVTGTPDAVSAGTYQITAINAVGSSVPASLTINVQAGIPTVSYSASTGTTGNVTGTMSIVPSTLKSNGSAVTNCTISPSLPSGLSLSPTTCEISGAPIAVSSATYQVTALNSVGSSSSAAVTVTVQASPPTLSYAGATGTSGDVGTAMSITPTTFANNGAAVSSCTSSPALPAGLSLSSTTCVISGTPDVLTTATAYTITATNSAGSVQAAVTLTVQMTCPAAYLRIPRNTVTKTTRDFCVAKYEMKSVGGVATSRDDLTPWMSISFATAKTKCTDLGGKYSLISNPEWMTIARNVELLGSNWSTGTAGSGMLGRGHSDGSAAVLPAGADNLPYTGTGNSAVSGWEQRRTLRLSTGDDIWDFSANAWEWVDWRVTFFKKAYNQGLTPDAWREWKSMDTGIGENTGDEMTPETWASSFIIFSNGIPTGSSLDALNGLGRFYAGLQNIGGFALRGGGPSAAANSGVFTLSLTNDGTVGATNIGFRCVFRP